MELDKLNSYLQESFECATAGRLSRCRELERLARNDIKKALGLGHNSKIKYKTLPSSWRRCLLMLEAIGHE